MICLRTGNAFRCSLHGVSHTEFILWKAPLREPLGALYGEVIHLVPRHSHG